VGGLEVNRTKGDNDKRLMIEFASCRETKMETLEVKTARRTQFVDVTDRVRRAVAKTGVLSGVCHVFVPHTTAGVIINEHFDPDVATDLEGVFERLVPRAGAYRHAEGNSDSHAKAVLTGASQMIFVEDGKLVLGQWQGVFFCEFDGPRERKLWVKILAEGNRGSR
jgi:secondary thiamine-phosphate synthase enzyme